MSIVGDIKNLYSDKEKTRALFPTTKIDAVSDDEGTGLNVILESMVHVGDVVSTTETAPINADTLGGRPAEDFATESFVANKIAEAQLSGGGSGDIDLSGYATKDDIANIDFPVDSVNGKTGAVQLSASDVGASPVITGAARSGVTDLFPAYRVMITDSAGQMAYHGTVTADEVGHLSGIRNNIQGQIDNNYNIAATAQASANTAQGTADSALAKINSSILNSDQYGTSLPSSAPAGKIFFKKV